MVQGQLGSYGEQDPFAVQAGPPFPCSAFDWCRAAEETAGSSLHLECSYPRVLPAGKEPYDHPAHQQNLCVQGLQAAPLVAMQPQALQAQLPGQYQAQLAGQYPGMTPAWPAANMQGSLLLQQTGLMLQSGQAAYG